jgi:hypothetical protein
LKERLQSGTSDKQDWKQYVFMSEKQRKELIDEKVNRAVKFVALAKKK